MKDDAEPITPRVCDACGGAPDAALCHWCTDGFQSPEQRLRWKKFRMRMRTMSGTYALFQTLIDEVIDKLEQNNTSYARELMVEGKTHLLRWLESDPDSEERENAASALARFHRKAVALLSR